jgi:hypothetical protein
MKKKITLDITSFKGISLGAIHYYGKLKYKNESLKLEVIRLENTISAEEAEVWNAHERRTYPGKKKYWNWEAGDTYDGFSRKSDMWDEAIKICKELFPEGSYYIVQGGYSYIEPQLIVYGFDEEVTEKLNIIASKHMNLNWDNKEEREEILRLEKEWSDIIEPLGGHRVD